MKPQVLLIRGPAKVVSRIVVSAKPRLTATSLEVRPAVSDTTEHVIGRSDEKHPLPSDILRNTAGGAYSVQGFNYNKCF